MPSYIDKEKTKKTISLILDKIGEEADPWLLGEYFSLFKKEVSVFHRSKVAAYLLMLCEQGKLLRLNGADNATPRKNGNNKRPLDARREDARRVPSEGRAAEDDAQHYPLADEESKRLFFSVGRSRRVFPRDILGLINTKTAVAREDIGVIRILDNYSFVQVRDTVAEQIIETLNGLSFKGRPLTVNYAKSRKDEENAASESDGDSSYNDEDYSASESVSEQESAEKKDI